MFSNAIHDYKKSLTRESSEVNKECVKQPLVRLWVKGSCVCGIRLQIGQLYPAGVTWQKLSGLLPS